MSFLKFPLTPAPLQQQSVARKCIVCGTTKHETNMKPFLLKGEQLNIWTNSYFGLKRHKLYNFYSKLRYTINPYACFEHFSSSHSHARVRTLRRAGKRTYGDLLGEGEEPPSIQSITERKPSPPPEEPKTQRTEEEVTNAIMEILKKAKEEMDNEDARRKMLRKITRQVMRHARNGEIDVDGEYSMKGKKKKKRKRDAKEGTERVVDGNEADSDNSETIDVTGIESEEGSTDSSSEEESVAKDVIMPPPRMPTIFPPGHPMLSPPPTVIMPRIRPKMPYMIAAPKHGEARRRLLMHVPRRLTLANSGANKHLHVRPSWVAPNPGQKTLASVLQKFWNEDAMEEAVEESSPTSSIPSKFAEKIPSKEPSVPFGRSMLPGTRTRFMPASMVAPFMRHTASPSKQTGAGPHSVRHPFIRKSILLNNPPLSPSRLIVGSEEIVETTVVEEPVPSSPSFQSGKDQLLGELYLSTSSSSSSESDDESYLDVCSEIRPPIQPGHKIEGLLEETEKKSTTRSRTSTMLSSISSTSEELERISSGDEELEVDVETVEEASANGGAIETGDEVKETNTPLNNDTSLAPLPQPTLLNLAPVDRRKQQMSALAVSNMAYRAALMAGNPKKFILPPSAIVKPPTKLLSAAQFSMKEALHAQARAAAGMPVRINTAGLLRSIKVPSTRLTDMPKLPSEARKTRQSEWSRLEAVVERKLAEHRAAQAEEKRKKLQEMVDEQLMSEHPPPVLKRVGGEVTSPTIDRKSETADSDALDEVMPEGSATRRSKVLRMRFHKKKVNLSALRVLDASTCPMGVAREEEVTATMEDDDEPPLIQREESLMRKELREKEEERKTGIKPLKKATRQVTHPSLVIDKEDVLEMQGQLLQSESDHCELNVPPPTPVVGIPNSREFAARREMYEKKRVATAVRASIRFFNFKSARKEWERKKMMEKEGEEKESEDEREAKEDAALSAEALKTVQLVREDRRRKAAKARKAEEKTRKQQEEEGILILSDIDDDGDVTMMVLGAKNRKRRRKERKEECEMIEMVEEKEGGEEEYCSRRKSHRLEEKRKTTGKRKPIWITSDDEEVKTAVASVQSEGKRKRGRPRKDPAAMLPRKDTATRIQPPPKKTKQVEGKTMTEEEKKVLDRVFVPTDTEEVNMEEMDGKEMEATMDIDGTQPALLEKQTPKPNGDVSMPGEKRRRMPCSWKQQLEGDGKMHNEMGGRVCRYCIKHLKRYVWTPNESMALLDHARTHCVETLMCPNKNCTYMNTQRSRISQHVTYVHKKWGMAIDLAEVYPSMRKSLALRLRQCFPDLSNLSVCQICRVAVRPDNDHHRWHAQSHLATQVFECSRNICTQKFVTEEECLEHIKVANCRGSVVSGLTDEMDEEVTELVSRCFNSLSEKNEEECITSEERGDREAHLATPSTSSIHPITTDYDAEMGVAGPNR